MDQPSSSTKKQIRNLLLLLSSAIVFAIGTGVFFVAYYSPSGVYLAKNALLAPEVLDKLKFNDTNSKTGGMSRFIFDSILFKWQDKQTHQWKNLYVDQQKYAKIYQLLSSDRSILDPATDVQEQFTREQPAQLTIMIRTENNSASQSFQQVQFIPGVDYYRVELHEQNAKARWAYYYHQKVFQNIFSILVPPI